MFGPHVGVERIQRGVQARTHHAQIHTCKENEAICAPLYPDLLHYDSVFIFSMCADLVHYYVARLRCCHFNMLLTLANIALHAYAGDLWPNCTLCRKWSDQDHITSKVHLKKLQGNGSVSFGI